MGEDSHDRDKRYSKNGFKIGILIENNIRKSDRLDEINKDSYDQDKKYISKSGFKIDFMSIILDNAGQSRIIIKYHVIEDG